MLSTKKKSKSNFITPGTIKPDSKFKHTAIKMSIDDIIMGAYNTVNLICKIPNKSEQIRIVTRKMMNSFDFILAILHKEMIENLYMAFFMLGKKVSIELNELQNEGKIGNIIFLINDGIPKLKPEIYRSIKRHESNKWRIKLGHTHTKIILMQTDNNYYIVEGSGNLSVNAYIEQYVFDNNEMIYNFHKSWIENI